MHATLDLQPPFESISHNWYPGSGKCRAYGTLRLGGGTAAANVYFHETAEIDAVIAELVALRADMTGDGATDAEAARWEVHVAHANRDGKLTPDELSARLAAMEPLGREHLLRHINGYCPAALLSALESEERSRAAREPEPPADGPGGVLFPADDEPAPREHPFDAGEGSRELSGPGRELLRAAIAEEDAAMGAAS